MIFGTGKQTKNLRKSLTVALVLSFFLFGMQVAAAAGACLMMAGTGPVHKAVASHSGCCCCPQEQGKAEDACSGMKAECAKPAVRTISLSVSSVETPYLGFGPAIGSMSILNPTKADRPRPSGARTFTYLVNLNFLC